MDGFVNDKNLDDADNEDNEEEEIVQFETSTEKKLNMWKFLKRLQLLNHTSLAENKLPKEHQLSISKVPYGVQTHLMDKPKKSPTIRSFFNSHKPNE